MAETELENGSIPVPAVDNTPETEIAEAPAKLSLRDQLKANFKEAAAPPAELRERERDETGKFTPKTEAKAPEPQPKAEAPVTEASKPINPPPGWSAESKAAFAALPDHFKNDVIKREKEVSDGFKKYSDDAKKYQEIEQVLSQSRPSYQQHGIRSDAEAISRLMQWEQHIRSNPSAALVNLARQYGIDLASLAQNPGQSNGQDALQQYIQPISQQINSVQSELARIQSERAQMEITQFSKDKPYFERVKTSMGQLIQAGLADNLETAYQKAIGMDPEIREEIQKAELDKRLSTHTQDAQLRSQQARKAAVSPSTRAPSAAVSVNGKSQHKGVKGSILSAIEQLREERA